MVYGKLNIFVKNDITLSNEEKNEYEEEIIKVIFKCLYDKEINDLN